MQVFQIRQFSLVRILRLGPLPLPADRLGAVLLIDKPADLLHDIDILRKGIQKSLHLGCRLGSQRLDELVSLRLRIGVHLLQHLGKLGGVLLKRLPDGLLGSQLLVGNLRLQVGDILAIRLVYGNLGVEHTDFSSLAPDIVLGLRYLPGGKLLLQKKHLLVIGGLRGIDAVLVCLVALGRLISVNLVLQGSPLPCLCRRSCRQFLVSLLEGKRRIDIRIHEIIIGKIVLAGKTGSLDDGLIPALELLVHLLQSLGVSLDSHLVVRPFEIGHN